MSAFYARSAWKFIELLPRFLFWFGEGFEMHVAMSSSTIVRCAESCAVYSRLVRLKRWKAWGREADFGRKESQDSQLVRLKRWKAWRREADFDRKESRGDFGRIPKLDKMKCFEGLGEERQTLAERKVEATLKSYPRLDRLKRWLTCERRRIVTDSWIDRLKFRAREIDRLKFLVLNMIPD